MCGGYELPIPHVVEARVVSPIIIVRVQIVGEWLCGGHKQGEQRCKGSAEAGEDVRDHCVCSFVVYVDGASIRAAGASHIQRNT